MCRQKQIHLKLMVLTLQGLSLAWGPSCFEFCNLLLQVSLSRGMSFSSHRTWMCLVLWIETKEVGKKPAQMRMSLRISVQAAQHTLSFVTSYSTSCRCDTASIPLPPVAALWLHHPFLCSSKFFRSSRRPTSFHLEALPSVP